MGTGGHALGRIARMREDVESLFCSGAGPIGLGVLAMAKVRFGRDFPVYISDVSPWRLEFAKSLGGIPVDVREPEAILELADIDAAVDSTGKTAVRAVDHAVLGKRGVLACVGHGEGLSLTVSPDLIATERTVMGSEYFRYAEMDENLELLLDQPRLRRTDHHPPLPRSQISEAFDAVPGAARPARSWSRLSRHERAAKVAVAVVGAGGWGEQHARIFAGRADTELVGIVGRTPERAQQRAAALRHHRLHRASSRCWRRRTPTW